MKTTFSPVLLVALCCAAFGGEPRAQKQFSKAVSTTGAGVFFYDFCEEDDILHWVVFSYDGVRPRLIGESKAERYAKVSAAGSRNPKATLYAGPNRPDTDLFSAAQQIYQVQKDGHVQGYSEQISRHELRSFLRTRPVAITADALLAHVKALRAEKH